MPSHKKLSKKKLALRTLGLLTGAILVAVALELFLVPNNVIDGGVTGISIMLSHLTSLPLGLFLVFLNLPFLYIGYKQIGKTFALSTLFSVIVMSIGTTFLHHVHSFTDDLLLASAFGGVLLGVGVGLVVRNGGSLDGVEIVAILLNKKSAFSVGEIVMFTNFFILGASGFVFGFDRAMYSLLAFYIAFRMIDVTIEGLDESKSVWVISDLHKEIGDAISERLGRSPTYLYGEGGYTGDQKKVVFAVITRLEEAKLKELVDEIDPGAFLATAPMHDVRGGRFKKKDIH